MPETLTNGALASEVGSNTAAFAKPALLSNSSHNSKAFSREAKLPKKQQK